MAAKGELVKEYLVKYKDALLSNEITKKGLARLIHLEHTELFPTIENARDLVRQYTGASGDEKRRFTNIVFEHKGDQNDMPKLPESVAEPIDDFIIPKSIGKALLLTDIHIPFHDINAINIAVDYGIKHGCKAVILNGDIGDYYFHSRYTKSPQKFSVNQEIQAVQDFLDWICSKFQHVYYKFGNHEVRWDTYLFSKAPEMAALRGFRLHEVLQLGSRKIHYIEHNQTWKFGKLNGIHGHELGGNYSPVNAAKAVFNRMLANTIHGHNHQSATHIQSNGNKEQIGVYSVGCLSTLTPEYMPKAYLKWSHGFALIEVDAEGYFRVENNKIINGKVC